MAHGNKRFYVYEAIGENGDCLYIGKGSGRRLEVQRKRFKCLVRIVKSFSSESAAYNFERRQIAARNPVFNKATGGGGPWVKKPLPKKPRPTEIERNIDRLGSRVYVARTLLGFDLSRVVPPVDLNALRMVAYG